MEIRDLVRNSGVPAKTIRYYEEIQLLPAPARKPNGYREYSEEDINRLKLVAGARRLDFSLAEISEILDLRDNKIAPCNVMLDSLEQKAREISLRIKQLQQLQTELLALHDIGDQFPKDDVEGKHCICHWVSERANH